MTAGPPDAPTAPPAHTPGVTVRPVPPEATHALRHAVLWPNVPASAQAQAFDAPPGVHLGAFATAPHSPRQGEQAPQEEAEHQPVGVLTLVPAPLRGEGDVQLRKFAVSPGWQGRGVGGAMLAAAAAHVPPGAVLHLDARREQVPFYAKRGFDVLDGTVFVKRGPGGTGPAVEYVRMGRTVE